MPSAFQNAVTELIAERNSPEYQIREHGSEIKDALKTLDLPTVVGIARKTIPACKGLANDRITELFASVLGIKKPT